jgi:hypothetical protein
MIFVSPQPCPAVTLAGIPTQAISGSLTADIDQKN